MQLNSFLDSNNFYIFCIHEECVILTQLDMNHMNTLSKMKAVDSNNFHFLSYLFSFILFLKLELGLK